MSIDQNQEFGAALCKALGLQGKPVVSIDIHVAVDEDTTITCKYYPSSEDAMRLLNLIEETHIIFQVKE